jgi:hypothetical protein
VVAQLSLTLVLLACGCSESSPCSSSHDLAGEEPNDLSAPSPRDLAAPDLAAVDLAGPDLGKAPDASALRVPDDYFVGPNDHVFVLPDDAQANAGTKIGPFCCDGRTVTVHSISGRPLGYANWYGFGWAYNYKNTSVAERISVLVSGPTDFADLSSQVQSSIEFNGNEIGSAGIQPDGGAPIIKSAVAGNLRFTAALIRADVVDLFGNGVLFIDMGSIRAMLYVENAR